MYMYQPLPEAETDMYQPLPETERYELQTHPSRHDAGVHGPSHFSSLSVCTCTSSILPLPELDSFE